MRRYTVTWWEAADDELTRLWLNYPDRSQIAHAAHQIDIALSTHADRVGEVVHEGLLRFEAAPLRIQFSIDEEDRVVRVWSVGLMEM